MGIKAAFHPSHSLSSTHSIRFWKQVNTSTPQPYIHLQTDQLGDSIVSARVTCCCCDADEKDAETTRNNWRREPNIKQTIDKCIWLTGTTTMEAVAVKAAAPARSLFTIYYARTRIINSPAKDNGVDVWRCLCTHIFVLCSRLAAICKHICAQSWVHINCSALFPNRLPPSLITIAHDVCVFTLALPCTLQHAFVLLRRSV